MATLLRADAGTAPLRIGVAVVEGEPLADWQRHILHLIAADARFSLAFRLTIPRVTPEPQVDAVASMVLQLDGMLLARGARRARGSTGDPLAALPAISCGARDPRVDVVLNLTSEPLPPSGFALARFGEWSLGLAGQRSGCADWAGFDPAARGEPLSPLEVIVRSGPTAEPVAAATASFGTKFSAARNAAFLREKSAALMLQALSALERARTLPDRGPPAPPAPPPGAASALRYGTSLVARLADRVALRAKAAVGADRHWTISIGSGAPDSFDAAAAVELPRASHTMADPFLFTHEGVQYVFYEAVGRYGERGHIAVGRLRGTDFEPLGAALRLPYHLSFPYVFRRGEDVFMMPETQQRRRLEVWRAVEFPLRWTLHAVALEGERPADSVFIEHDGDWWLLTNLSRHLAFQDHSSELYVFRADGPELRRLEPHRQNPVVVGSATARNGGSAVSHDGKLYRCSQMNVGGYYGYALNIMRVDALTMDTYAETLVRRITPDFRRGLAGVHHVSFDAGVFVIDTCRVG